MRKIIHCDADCFFAAVEERDDPSLKGLPVAVGGTAADRGVIATCNYVARGYGIHSAMPTAVAQRLCPSLVLLPPDMPRYREVSARLGEIFQRFTPTVEAVSLDEAYLDVTESPFFGGSATYMAEAIRHQVARELGITVSAGVAPNKFIAKVASDWLKPNGLFVVTPAQVPAFVEALSVARIPGVGPVGVEKLGQLGVETCGQLQFVPRPALHQHFGAFGERLYQFAHGEDARAVTPERTRKSVSVEHTYAFDLPDRETAKARLPALHEKLLKRIQSLGRGYCVQSPFIKLKFCDFSVTTLERGALLPSLPAFGALLDMAYQRGQKPLRLIGIGVSVEEQSGQLVLI